MVQAQRDSAPTFVVGVGASAGGLEALEAFFHEVPIDTGMAFVVVQHLSPDFKSVMNDLLGRQTSLPIHLVEDGMPVEANHVYLIPPKKEMIIAEGRLLLSERDRQHELALPIDVFFRSLAQDAGPRAIAVVLSGSGSDGSRGVRHVHESGGLVIVQDPATAQFDGMPLSAIESGVAHHVVAPREIAHMLAHHAAAESKARHAEPLRETPTGIAAVYQMLLDEFGLDFTHYKPSTVTRRIERRLALAESVDMDAYVQRLERERDELDVLYRDLLIGVTRFFRDKAAFDVLEQQVLPDLAKRGGRDAPLRIWVAGCATGEEAYSLAIAAQEVMAKHGQRPVKLFATDIHPGSLERAARGLYDEEAVANVSPERLERWFSRIGNAYQVLPELRQMVVFARHNVIRDAPFTRVDLVTCRNLLIYLQVPAQQKVLSLLHFALNRGGVLFLGPSESAGPFVHDFESLDKHWRIYRKQSDVRVPSSEMRVPAFPPNERAQLPHSSGRQSFAQLLTTYDVLLDDVMPPSLLLSERGEVVHAFGGASRFLRPRDGRQGLEILSAVDDELKMVLVGGLKRALHEPNALVFKGVSIGEETFDVTIRHVRNKARTTPHVLVSFEARGHEEPKRPTREIDLDQVSRGQLAMVEAELDRTKENLQAAIEELETSNEELSAANEELQASNEELQSTNEELQSVNEELYTVNGEYQRKIGELTELTNDMDNLLSSTEVGTIFLDAQLRIRKFTPQIAETFALVPHDVGRRIETFAHKLDHEGLVDDLKRVLQTGAPIERELSPAGDKTFFMRILPYRVRGKVDGVVLTVIDVTGLKMAENALFHERYLLNSLLATVQDGIYFKDRSGRFIRANEAVCAWLGTDTHGIVNKTVLDVGNRELALALHRKDEIVLRSGEAQHDELEEHVGATQWARVTRLPLRDESNDVVGLVVIVRDVSEHKRAEERIHQQVRRRDEFLAMLSHELRNPLGAIVGATRLLADGGTERIRAGQLVEILDRQSKQMARLLDDLLEVSRVTQNKIELRKTAVDLRDVVRDAIAAAQGDFDARGVALRVEIGDRPLIVDADAARLQQVHVNLLANAAKYTPRGGHVHLVAGVEDGGACVRVRDDGLGIPTDMLEPIFDLFVQSQATLDRSSGGLGVGLTLVRSLVTMHGGSVTAHSDGAGRGSEFVVRLPLASAEPVHEPTRDAPRATLPKGAKVLVVEDNKDSREMFCEMLERAGYACRTADDGLTALAAIEEFRPHVAILDIGLPNLDGFEVARRVRSDPKNTAMRLIALTGYGRASDRAAAVEAGFDAHLVKPVDNDGLLALLSSARPLRE